MLINATTNKIVYFLLFWKKQRNKENLLFLMTITSNLCYYHTNIYIYFTQIRILPPKIVEKIQSYL